MMRWLLTWLRKRPELTVQQQQRLNAWTVLPRKPLGEPFSNSRCVVVDVETSGLNLTNDRLISIGAVAVVHGQVALSDSFSVVLQQTQVSGNANILVHGIGGTEQSEGMPAADALVDFLEYLGKDPLIAFHVTFDRTMIQRAMRHHVGIPFQHTWLDLAYIMPAFYPALAARYRSLDDWASHFSIHNDARHNALADAFVTAQLFQVALHQAARKNIRNLSALLDQEKAQRWVSGVDRL
jgi:DNA polymerase III subunit epsilon